ncbi:30S ribosomal protein S9, partial [Candidatus Nomurabacteria bacterium]|nr:30S ribosomal protein S9 [Candidatus Nomurabacteria bacterium]
MTTKDSKKYIEAIGRRKTSTARVRIVEDSKNSLSVNGVDVSSYFKTKELVNTASEALTKH